MFLVHTSSSPTEIVSSSGFPEAKSYSALATSVCPSPVDLERRRRQEGWWKGQEENENMMKRRMEEDCWGK